MKYIKFFSEITNRINCKTGPYEQTPGIFPEIAKFLVKEGISSISFNPDAVARGIKNINKAEASK